MRTARAALSARLAEDLRPRADQPAAAGPANRASWPGSPTPRSTTDLAEWDYGDYEGITTDEIREAVPGWTIWTHPSPGGETADQVGARLDRVVARARARRRRHAGVQPTVTRSRALAARWLGLPVGEGRLLRLDTSTVSVLGHEREQPVVLRWNS